MRGFTETKQAQIPVMGEAFYQYAIKNASREDVLTARARAIFHTPPYCFGERRHEYERQLLEENI